MMHRLTRTWLECLAKYNFFSSSIFSITSFTPFFAFCFPFFPLVLLQLRFFSSSRSHSLICRYLLLCPFPSLRPLSLALSDHLVIHQSLHTLRYLSLLFFFPSTYLFRVLCLWKYVFQFVDRRCPWHLNPLSRDGKRERGERKREEISNNNIW